MRTRILKFAKWLLLIWGGLSLVGVLAVTAYVVFSIGQGNRDKDGSASQHDVRYVLNWCQLGDQRIEKVIQSHVSTRSFTGDHLDAYAIKISQVDLAELTASTNDFSGRWYRCDQLPKVLEDAVAFASGWHTRFLGSPPRPSLRPQNFTFILGASTVTGSVLLLWN